MKKLIPLIAILCFSFSASASHVAGAEIWYEHDTLNDYIIHLKLYRDCGPGSAQLGPTANVLVRTASQMSSVTVNLDTAGTNNPLNATSVYTCVPNTCNNLSATLHGYQMWHYTGTATLPVAANDWVISYNTCCRNANSTTNGQPGTYISTTLDNLTIPFNNGLAVPYSAPYFFSVNGSYNVSYAVVETDGDSLDYRFTTAMAQVSTMTPAPVSYLAPNTPQNPFPNSTLSLNAQTGLLSFTPTMVGNYVIAIETREFRNGVQIGSSTRDHQIVVVSGAPGNNLPNLSGINGAAALTHSINYCGSMAMNFTINSSDPNLTDSTSVVLISGPVGATVNTNTAQNQTATFNWPITQSLVRTQPYTLILEVRDNYCGSRQEVYQLFVNNCSTDSVWAGDANADFTCDNYDILNIGIANGQTGAVRAGATLNWQAEWCPNWTNSFISNINYKHADCNGDGTVDATDLAAVTANYGLVHQKKSNVGQYKTLGLPDLYCDLSNVQAYKGSTVTIPVLLGQTGSLMDDFYGISATVELLNAQASSPISISKNTSWIGNASNSFAFEKSSAANKVAFTFVRNDQQNLMAQQGQIGEITFPIDANSVTGSEATVQFSDIKIIKNTGEEINDYNVLADKLTILAPLGINDLAKGFSAFVFPNPTKSIMTILLEVDKTQDYNIALYDVVGKLLNDKVYNGTLSNGKHNIDLDLSKRAAGQYQLEISSENGKTVLPVMKR